MARLKVAVLRGGPSSEYDVSLKTGGEVLRHMPEDYEKHDVFISRDGMWHVGGVARSPERILRHVDVAFNALHGSFGEDGKIQQLFEKFGVRYTGSGPLPSAVGMNKLLSKQLFEKQGIRTPRHIILRKEHVHHNGLLDIFRSFELGFSYSPTLLLEEYIRGKEVTCGVVDHFRDKQTYALLPVFIDKPKVSGYFDYESKYSGENLHHLPKGYLTEDEIKKIENLAVTAHEALGLRHYSRSDFIVSKQGIYILEINTLPGLTPDSLFPFSLEAIGCTLPQFIDHVLNLALSK
ncbi:ATP-grasp domain-containing protein [Candidatus Parcubacteria bacterium]|nr:ATP-grasp domain-containing protein [Candidatus Parcubacteria bacterium]